MNSDQFCLEEWIIRDVRDRSLQVIATQMAYPAGLLSIDKLQSKQSVDVDAIERIVLHVTDVVIERLFFELDQRITMGDIGLEVRSTSSELRWLRMDSDSIDHRLFEDWIEKHSAVKGVSELHRLIERNRNRSQ